MKYRQICAILCFSGALMGMESPAVAPKIETLVSADVLSHVMNDRAIDTRAHLEGHHYSVRALVLIKASFAQTHDALTDYSLYAKMIPYIDRSDYTPADQMLWVEGGIWKFKLSSHLKFETKSPEWIKFRVVSGHFAGMEGNIYFEPEGEKGTLVLLDAEQTAEEFPPKFIIEQGAQIVFGFTAKRMRSYIEGLKNKEFEKNDESNSTPRPRSHL